MVVCSVDVGYGNTKFCGDKGGEMFWGHFPSIATLPTGIDRGANVMAKRDLVEVESNGDRYIVGRDCMDTLSARDDRGRSLLANYVETPQHLAFLRGALAYIGESRIDLLVSGLPINHFAKDRERMADKLKGVHPYPDGRSVLVKDAWVVPQPVGGFISYFMSTNQLDRLADIKSLTIDVGYFTVDWLVCRGLKLQDERSGSAAGGMSMVMGKLAQLISEDRQAPFSDINMVDAGIRNGFKTRIQGKEYDFSHFIPKMEAFIITAIQSVISSVGSLDDIDVIVLVGGGAKFYYDTAKKLLDNREIIVPEESIYSNVRGFYWAGSERMRKIGG